MSHPEAREAQDVVCTLTTKARATRVIEWSNVGELCTSRKRLDDGVSLTFDLMHAAGVEDLAEREMDCCGSWLRAETSRGPDHIRLDLTAASPEGIATIASMADVGD